MNNDKIVTIAIKQYTTKELAAMYKVDRRTFQKWLKPFAAEIGQRVGYYFNIVQVRIIFDKLKLPSFVQVKDETVHFS